MLSVVLIEHIPDMYNDFAGYLRKRELKVFQTTSENNVFELLESESIDAVVAMEQDLSLVKKLVAAFPMVNYALFSEHEKDDFHEATEGYGIFMQLPPSPQEQDASTMVCNLIKIKMLSTGMGEVENDN